MPREEVLGGVWGSGLSSSCCYSVLLSQVMIWSMVSAVVRLPGCSGAVGGDRDWIGRSGLSGVMESVHISSCLPPWLTQSPVIGRTDRTMWQKNQIFPSTSCETMQPS